MNLPCAILVPSLNRPQRLVELVNNIREATPEDHRVLFCVSDPQSIRILTEMGEWFLDDSEDEDRRYVTRMNKLIREIGDARTIFFGSDDIRFHTGWLTKALKVMDQGAEVVVVNDLRNPNGTQALVKVSYLDRAVFDSPGMAFHPGYHHNFADTEQFFTAYKRGVYARALDSYVEHLHPLFNAPNSIPWDETYKNGALANWDVDQALFQQRAQQIDQLVSP